VAFAKNGNPSFSIGTGKLYVKVLYSLDVPEIINLISSDLD